MTFLYSESCLLSLENCNRKLILIECLLSLRHFQCGKLSDVETKIIGINEMSEPFDSISPELNTPKIDLILPDTGKLFYEQKTDFVFCQPHLMPLKSVTLEKLEKMQKQAQEQLKETRAKTAATNTF